MKIVNAREKKLGERVMLIVFIFKTQELSCKESLPGNSPAFNRNVAQERNVQACLWSKTNIVLGTERTIEIIVMTGNVFGIDEGSLRGECFVSDRDKNDRNISIQLEYGKASGLSEPSGSSNVNFGVAGVARLQTLLEMA